MMRAIQLAVNMLRLLIVGLLGVLTASNVNAAPLILVNAVPTISLQGAAGGLMGNVAYHPDFDQYYSGQLGSNSLPVQVWDSNGNLLQTAAPTNSPWRGFHFNPNTNNVEFTTFNAVSGNGSTTGLFQMGLNAGGLYTDTNSNLLVSVPGIGDTQPNATYDPLRNRLYTIQNDNIVNVSSYASGSLITTIALDTVAAGIGINDLTEDGIGFDPINDVFVSLHAASSRAMVFDINGSFLGASILPGSLPARFNIGYDNGQLFVLQGSDYNGFQIFGAAVVPEPSSIVLFGLGTVGLVLMGRRQRKRKLVA